MLSMIFIILCLALTYLIIAIFYNWKHFSLKNLWNIRFVLTVMFNTIILIFSFPLIAYLTHSIHWTAQNLNGQTEQIYPLEKIFFSNDYGKSVIIKFLAFLFAFILIGLVLLYLPNKYMLRIKNNWKCVLLTIILSLVPLFILLMNSFIYKYLHILIME
jgi:hypothetical protein